MIVALWAIIALDDFMPVLHAEKMPHIAYKSFDMIYAGRMIFRIYAEKVNFRIYNKHNIP